MTTATQTLSDFLLARIAEDEAPSWRLVPYACPPDCCAPAGYVGRECLICGELTYGGTPEAIEEIAREHAETMHQRTRVLAQCAAFRAIVGVHEAQDFGVLEGIGHVWMCRECRDRRAPCPTLRLLASIWRDHDEFQEAWL